MTMTATPMTRILAVSMLALSLALPLAAQESQETSQGSQEASQEAQDAERVTAEEIQAEFDEAFETIRAYSEDQRDEAVAAMRETLSEIDTEIAEIEQRARENWADMSEATQEQTRETLNALRERRNELSEAFGEMQAGSASAWDEVQDGVANAWTEVKGAWNAVFEGTETSNGNAKLIRASQADQGHAEMSADDQSRHVTPCRAARLEDMALGCGYRLDPAWGARDRFSLCRDARRRAGHRGRSRCLGDHGTDPGRRDASHWQPAVGRAFRPCGSGGGDHPPALAAAGDRDADNRRGVLLSDRRRIQDSRQSQVAPVPGLGLGRGIRRAVDPAGADPAVRPAGYRLWAIGLLVGIDLIFLGAAEIAMASAFGHEGEKLMIEITHSRQDDSLLIRVIGKVSRRDIDLAVPEIENAVELAEEPLKLMIRLEDFEGFEIGGLWHDKTFGMLRVGAFGRIAVVGDSTLEKLGTSLAAPFAGTELRFFLQEREDAAWEWLGVAQ